jgi:hypothetical protein
LADWLTGRKLRMSVWLMCRSILQVFDVVNGWCK